MANITKTDALEVLALQSVASNTVLISAVLDVSTHLASTIFIHFGRRATAALTAGVIFRIEASSKASGDGHWYPLAVFQTATALAETEAATGTNAAGQNVITMASTTNLTVADIIYIDNTTVANGEFHRIKAVSANVSITLEDNLTNAQNNPAATIFDQAEMFVAQLDLTAIKRLRLVVDADNTGQAVAVESHMVRGDSIG